MSARGERQAVRVEKDQLGAAGAECLCSRLRLTDSGEILRSEKVGDTVTDSEVIGIAFAEKGDSGETTD
jgi:hypothetical protein